MSLVGHAVEYFFLPQAVRLRQVPIAFVAEELLLEIFSVLGEYALSLKLSVFALSFIEGSVRVDENTVIVLCLGVDDGSVVGLVVS